MGVGAGAHLRRDLAVVRTEGRTVAGEGAYSSEGTECAKGSPSHFVYQLTATRLISE